MSKYISKIYIPQLLVLIVLLAVINDKYYSQDNGSILLPQHPDPPGDLIQTVFTLDSICFTVDHDDFFDGDAEIVVIYAVHWGEGHEIAINEIGMQVLNMDGTGPWCMNIPEEKSRLIHFECTPKAIPITAEFLALEVEVGIFEPIKWMIRTAGMLGGYAIGGTVGGGISFGSAVIPSAVVGGAAGAGVGEILNQALDALVKGGTEIPSIDYFVTYDTLTFGLQDVEGVCIYEPSEYRSSIPLPGPPSDIVPGFVSSNISVSPPDYEYRTSFQKSYYAAMNYTPYPQDRIIYKAAAAFGLDDYHPFGRNVNHANIRFDMLAEALASTDQLSIIEGSDTSYTLDSLRGDQDVLRGAILGIAYRVAVQEWAEAVERNIGSGIIDDNRNIMLEAAELIDGGFYNNGLEKYRLAATNLMLAQHSDFNAYTDGDYNNNGVIDQLEILEGYAKDNNSNGIPDETESKQSVIIDVGNYSFQFESYSNAINDYGQTIGYASYDEGSRGFVYNNHNLIDIPTFSDGLNGIAFDINNAGIIVGESGNSEENFSAFIYQNNTLTDLGTLGGEFSYGRGINDSSMVVGFSTNQSGQTRGFLWDGDNGMKEIATLGGNYSKANKVNNSIQVIGESETNDGYIHAFLWENEIMTDLGTLGEPNLSSSAIDINDHGQIVGNSEIEPGIKRAFLFQDGEMINIGTLGGNMSEAYGINNLGQIVGKAQDENGLIHAFLAENGNVNDLNDLLPENSNWELVEATSINNRGEIVGWGYHFQEVRAFFMTTNSSVNSLEVDQTENIIQYFSLSQNYPNPFNPTTKISYTIPKSSFVTIKVYDVLGREVVTLMNQKLNPGNYEVGFDGGNLSSDIYFYRLEAVNPESKSDQVYSETRKMLLLK